MQHYLILLSKNFRFFLSKTGTIQLNIIINNPYWNGPAKFSLIFPFHNYSFSTEDKEGKTKCGRQQSYVCGTALILAQEPELDLKKSSIVYNTESQYF